MSALQVSTAILQWVADQYHLTIEGLVDEKLIKDMKFPPSKREQFLRGEFTVSQIEKLAKKSRIPFGYFFLDTPPEDFRTSIIPDLRQSVDHIPLSDDFYDTLDDILRKQQWYLEFLKEHGAEKLPFVGRFQFIPNSLVPIEKIVTDIRHTLELSIDEQKDCNDAKKFFSLLSEKAENKGILVFKNSIVKNSAHRPLSVSEFRGFAIADNYAPIIFINGKDSEAALVFTLAHELAHIWLGKSGVSDIAIETESMDVRLETYCNQIAAEMLVPKGMFMQAWDSISESENKYLSIITILSKQFKVSRWVIAKRAFDFGKIGQDTYEQIIKITKNNTKPTSDTSPKRGDPYRTYPIRNSKRLTQTIVNSAMSGHTMLREAANLLNIKPQTVVEMSKRLSSL